MPNYGAPWDWDESQGYGDDHSEADFFGGSAYWENEQNRIYRPIWKPGDPEVGYFSPTMEERRQYRDNASFLATGMAPLCSGSDTGGSLRNPAAFCGIVGYRPSPGLVPSEKRGPSSPTEPHT